MWGAGSKDFLAIFLSLVLFAACHAPTEKTSSPKEQSVITADLEEILSDPVERSKMIVKVMGSTEREDTYAFMKFHIYGYNGGNLIPFYTMNNVVVQKWTPMEEPGYFDLQHYEVGYFSEFDTPTPIETWENPITGETVEIPPLILGPIAREYTPEGITAPGLAPKPLNISVIGERLFIPTQSIDKFYNPMSTPDWGEWAGSPDIYWDSMLTYSADVADVLNPKISRAKAEIHMQNLISWSPFLKMGTSPGRTMVRAYGTHIDSLDDLPPEVIAGLRAHTPAIFETDDWTELRIDAVDFMMEVRAKLDGNDVEEAPLE